MLHEAWRCAIKIFHNFFVLPSILSLATLCYNLLVKYSLSRVEPIWKQIKWKTNKRWKVNKSLNSSWELSFWQEHMGSFRSPYPGIGQDKMVTTRAFPLSVVTMTTSQLLEDWVWPRDVLPSSHSDFLRATSSLIGIFPISKFRFLAFMLKWNWQHWPGSYLATINCSGVAVSPSDLLAPDFLVDIPCLPPVDILYLTILQFLLLTKRGHNLSTNWR